MNTETGVFAEMLEKYNANESLTADAATIGIADMMTGLETTNTEFDILYGDLLNPHRINHPKQPATVPGI